MRLVDHFHHDGTTRRRRQVKGTPDITIVLGRVIVWCPLTLARHEQEIAYLRRKWGPYVVQAKGTTRICVRVVR